MNKLEIFKDAFMPNRAEYLAVHLRRESDMVRACESGTERVAKAEKAVQQNKQLADRYKAERSYLSSYQCLSDQHPNLTPEICMPDYEVIKEKIWRVIDQKFASAGETFKFLFVASDISTSRREDFDTDLEAFLFDKFERFRPYKGWSFENRADFEMPG